MFRSRGEIIRVPAVKNPMIPSTQEYEYACDICGNGCWCSETEVAFHVKLCHKNEIRALVRKSSNATPVCLICFKKQPDTKTLICHYKEIHLFSSPTASRVEREIFICDFCDQIFFNKLKLELHIFQRHMGKLLKYKLYCPLCLKIVRRYGLPVHLRTHQIQSLSSCPICLKKCENKVLMLKHVTETHRKHFLCNICGFQTTREDIFNNHLDRYKNKPSGEKRDYRKFFLKPRTKAMWKHSVLRYGLKGLEIYNGIYICILCREICVSKKQRSIHIRRDHNVAVQVPKKIHRCSCGEEWVNAVLLKHHLFKMKHLGHYEIKCELPENAAENLLEFNDMKEAVDFNIEVYATEDISDPSAILP